MLGLFDDLSQQSSRGTEVVVLIGQQVLEHHRQELQTEQKKGTTLILRKHQNLKHI